MILLAEDYTSIKEDIDLDKVKNMSFYYKKVCAVAKQTAAFESKIYNEQRCSDARKIKKIIEELFPEYTIWVMPLAH